MVCPEAAELELMLRHPMHFRENLMIDATGSGPKRFGDVMEPWQRKDFEAMDPCLRWMAGRDDTKPKWQRFFRMRPRGHSKTGDTATSVMWLLLSSQRPLFGIAAAEDKEQAALVRDAMEKIADDNPWIREVIQFKNWDIVNKGNKAHLSIISSDTNSSYGLTPDFVLADEFTHWSQQKFWSSVFSSFTKRAKKGMLIVLCNAGAGRDWRFKVMDEARNDPRWNASLLDGPQASWITKEDIDEQRRMLPRLEFERLWMNKWQETGGEFVTLTEAQACSKPDRIMTQGAPFHGTPPYVASLDFAEKKDYTVGVVIHEEDRKIVVDRMDVIVPTPETPTRVEWVENWMRNMVERYYNVIFVLDKYQLLGVAQRLIDEGYDITYFDFGSGNGNYELGLVLRQLIVNEYLEWYPKCGLPENPVEENDDLEHELASLVVIPYQNGRKWRFDHLQDGFHHDDRAFALGAACLHLIRLSGGFGEWDIEHAPSSNPFAMSS